MSTKIGYCTNLLGILLGFNGRWKARKGRLIAVFAVFGNPPSGRRVAFSDFCLAHA